MRPGPAYTPAGVAAAAGGTFAWGIGIIFIKLTTSPFVVVSFYRHVFALPVLAFAYLISRDRSLPWVAGSLGGALFALHQLAHFGALRNQTAAVATILFSLQPLVVGMAGRRFTGERTTPRFYLWSLVAIAGCGLLVVATADAAQASPLGTLLAIANLFAWSAYFLATKRARERTTATAWLLVMTLVSGSILGLIALIFRQPFGAPMGAEWLYMLGLALIPATIGHYLVTWAHPRIHAAAASSIVLGVPVIASVLAALLFDEPFGPMHVLGGAIAIAGAAAAIRHLPPPVVKEAEQTFGELAT